MPLQIYVGNGLPIAIPLISLSWPAPLNLLVTMPLRERAETARVRMIQVTRKTWGELGSGGRAVDGPNGARNPYS